MTLPTNQPIPCVRQQGRTVLPQAVTYAAVLDRLNWAISRDWRVLEACHHVWAGSHNLVGLLKDSGAFEAAKAYLIEGATGLPAFYQRAELPLVNGP